MAENINAQSSNGKSNEEKELEKQVVIAELQKKIAQAEYEAAKAKKDAAALTEPQSDKEKAQLEKEIAEANKAAILAKREILKGPEIKVLDGKITSEGVFIESRILANKTLTSAFNGFFKDLVKKDLFKKDKVTFVIYNPSDFPAMELYATMLDQLNAMKEVYETTIQSADIALKKQLELTASASVRLADPLTLGYAAAGMLRTTADIVSLFRTNTIFNNFDLAVDETALIANFTKEIVNAEKHNWIVFHPSLYPINTIKPANNSNSKFITALNELKAFSNMATAKIKEIEKKVVEFKDQIVAENDEIKKGKILEHINMFSPIIAELQNLNSTFTQLEKMLSATDTTTKITAQAMIMRAERTVNKLNEDDVYIIKISAISKGSNRITQNLFRSRIMHSAGTELSCLIFAPDGHIVYADSRNSYTPYEKAGDIR